MTRYTVDTVTTKIVQQFREAEEKVARERGGFSLFGLFELEEPSGSWDLVAAAPWLSASRNDIKELIDALSAFFNVKDWKIIAAVVPIREPSDFVDAVTSKYHVEHGVEEIGRVYLSGLYVNHAFLITSNPASTPIPALREPAAA